MSTGISDVLRPDGRLLVRSAEAWTSEAAADAAELAKRRRVPALAHIHEQNSAEHAVLIAAGFAESRRQAVVAIPLERALAALRGAALPAGVDLRSAADVDEDRLRLLDDELRQDVPGTSGWRSTPEEFRDHTFADPDFDPRTYLVAVDRDSDDYLGLVRVWMTPRGPRLGMVGVRRERRRQGIASALVANALEAVEATGATEVTMEYDLENVASRTLAERLGARRLGTEVELVYEPEQEPSRVG
jgi:RimJ/RimL family protein N-acetyltransferase